MPKINNIEFLTLPQQVQKNKRDIAGTEVGVAEGPTINNIKFLTLPQQVLKNKRDIADTAGEISNVYIGLHALDDSIKDLENANMVKDVSYESLTHKITFTFYDNTTQLLDLPLESTIVGASYDNATKDITFTLQNGSTLIVPLDDLVSGLASETWVDTKLSNYYNRDDKFIDEPITKLNNHTLREVFESGNLVVNGDFSDGITGWTTTTANQSVSLGINTFLATAENGRIKTISGSINTNKYFISARIKTNSNLVGLRYFDTVYHSGSGEYEHLSHIATATVTLPEWEIIVIDTHSSGWTQIDVDYVYAINITSLGIEDLTVEEIDYWFNVYQATKDKSMTSYLLEALNQRPLIEQGDVLKPNFMHISSDDCIEIFNDLTANVGTYTSIFDNSILSFLKSMHDTYGMVFSFYCYYSNSNGFDLSMATDAFKNEFKANSSWLKFGYHGEDYLTTLSSVDEITAKTYYDKVMNELFRIMGSWECFDRVPRFHGYVGNINAINACKKTNASIIGLLTSEDIRMNYHLTTSQNDYLQTHDRLYDYENNIHFFSTDFRLESVGNVNVELSTRLNSINYVNRMNDLIIFTHEEFLGQTTMQTKIEQCCEFAVNNGYMFDFPQNRLYK